MQINEQEVSGVFVYNVVGDIDINSAPEMKKTFDAVTKDKKEQILIDLKEVEYVDSSGLATLVEVLKNVRVYSGKFKIASLTTKVKGLFEITKLDKLFDIYADADAALASF